MENQPKSKKYLAEKRGISLGTITNLETQKLITCYEKELHIAMKDIEGELV